MEKSVIQIIVNRAIRFLNENPYDIAHGLDHHNAVLKNAKEINRHEALGIDEDILAITVMWHDVMVNNKGGSTIGDKREVLNDTLEYLQELLIKNAVDSNEIKLILSAIRNHEYSKSQAEILSKLLFDADKLELVNANRWQDIIDDVINKNIPIEKLSYYMKVAANRVHTLQDRLYFSYSLNELQKRVKHFSASSTMKAMCDLTRYNMKADLVR